MALSKKSVEGFQKIFKEEHGKELTYEEADEAGSRLVDLFTLLHKFHIEDLKKKDKLKEFPKGYSYMDGKTYSCGICGN